MTERLASGKVFSRRGRSVPFPYGAVRLLLLTMGAFFGAHLHAGELRDFEQDVVQNSSMKEAEAESDTYSDVTEALFDSWFDVLVSPLLEGGARSFARASTASDLSVIPRTQTPVLSPRTPGERELPVLRLDIGSGKLESDIETHALYLEFGYGPFAAITRQVKMTEASTDDELDISQYLFSYRSTLAEGVLLSLGGGPYRLTGNASATGTAVYFAPRVRVMERLEAEYRVSIVSGGLRLTEHEVLFTYGPRYLGLQAGYRLLHGDTENLQGAFAGLCVSF